MNRPWVGVTLLIVFAGAWSVSLGVLGVWLIAEPHTGFLGNRWVSGSAGVIALCAAQLVFLICAVDRVFPTPHSWLRSAAHAGNMTILGVSACVMVMASVLASV